MQVNKLDYAVIGDSISKLRKQKNMTREQLAERTGVSTSHIGNIETANARISLSLIISLSDVLEAPLDYIIGGSSENRLLSNKYIAESIFSECTQLESDVLLEILSTFKVGMRQHNEVLRSYSQKLALYKTIDKIDKSI